MLLDAGGHSFELLLHYIICLREIVLVGQKYSVWDLEHA